MKRSNGWTWAVGAALALTVIGCGDSASDEPTATDVASPSPTDAVVPASTDDVAPPVTDAAAPSVDGDAAAVTTELSPGPVTLVALGDSLTAGEGDDSGIGYVGRLAESIGATPGREDPSIVNLGASGWDSTMMISGQDGTSGGQLETAVAEVEAAVAGGRAVLATLLIGSNDMWYLYEYGPPEGTPPENEDAAEATYRANLERAVSELTTAGAVVVLGLPDDQSFRPAVVDIDQLHNYLPSVTEEEVQQMSAMAARLGAVVEEIAAQYGLRTVDTNAQFWADPASMADDGIHPNGDGYAALAELWLAGIYSLL
jgi:lysophospholipase L1-like esterase